MKRRGVLASIAAFLAAPFVKAEQYDSGRTVFHDNVDYILATWDGTESSLRTEINKAVNETGRRVLTAEVSSAYKVVFEKTGRVALAYAKDERPHRYAVLSNSRDEEPFLKVREHAPVKITFANHIRKSTLVLTLGGIRPGPWTVVKIKENNK